MYTYHLRPGYGTDKLLLEFIQGTDDPTFITNLLAALADIAPAIVSVGDYWLYDEFLLTVQSTQGEFLLSKDSWNFVFILAEDNQPCILAINECLAENPLFEKVEVDFTNYRLPDPSE